MFVIAWFWKFFATRPFVTTIGPWKTNFWRPDLCREVVNVGYVLAVEGPGQNKKKQSPCCTGGCFFFTFRNVRIS